MFSRPWYLAGFGAEMLEGDDDVDKVVQVGMVQLFFSFSLSLSLTLSL